MIENPAFKIVATSGLEVRAVNLLPITVQKKNKTKKHSGVDETAATVINN